MDDAPPRPAVPAVEPLRPTGMPELWFSADAELIGTWTLRQGGHVVGVLAREPEKTTLDVDGGAWNVRIRSGGGGWSAVFTRTPYGDELTYRPRLVRGGDFHAGNGARYRLTFKFLRGRWLLADDSRQELASIGRYDRTRAGMRVQLGRASATTSTAAVLILASCLAIVWDHFAPKGGHGGG